MNFSSVLRTQKWVGGAFKRWRELKFVFLNLAFEFKIQINQIGNYELKYEALKRSSNRAWRPFCLGFNEKKFG